MEDEDIKEIIINYCNPTTQADIFKILSVFEELEYDKHVNDIYEIMSANNAGLIDNVPFLLRNKISIHAIRVLEEIGIIVEDLDTSIRTLALLIEYTTAIPNMSKVEAIVIHDDMEISEDDHELVCKAISNRTGIPFTEVYSLVEKVTGIFTNNFKKIIETIINTDDVEVDDINVEVTNYKIKSIITETLRMLNDMDPEHKLLGLKIINDEMVIDNEIALYVKLYYNNINTTNPKLIALDIISLMLLCKDSRHDLENTYINIFEDLMETEQERTSIYKEFKDILITVNEFIHSLDNSNVFSKEGSND